jgi:CDP-diacylglycerol--serine O-phosphatidyltransferase
MMAYRLTNHPGSGGLTDPQRLARRRRGLRRRVGALPAAFTLGNLLCGFTAIFYASRAQLALPAPGHPSHLTVAALLIFLGMLFDALDGRVARLTRHTTDMGMELDSMADMVSFGVAPAFLVVQLVQIGTPFLGPTDFYFDRATLVIACIYVACAALRLARFNVEVKGPAVIDHMYFKGLPSPGAAGTLASLVLLHQNLMRHTDSMYWTTRAAALAMVAVMLLTAFAMVSRFRYVHVVNRYLRGRLRFTTVARGVVVILLLLIYPRQALCAGLVAYALSAPCAWLWRWVTGRPVSVPAPAAPARVDPAAPPSRRDVV